MRSHFLYSLPLAALCLASVSHAQTGGTPQVVHAFGDFGDHIGQAGFVKSTNPVVDEIFLSGRIGEEFWQAIRFDDTTGTYLQTFISPHYEDRILKLAVGNVLTNIGDEILVVLPDGRIDIHDQRNKELLASVDTGIDPVTAFETFDLDGDGALEFALVGMGRLHLIDSDGSLISVHPGVDGIDMAIGQMDQDPGLEIAVTSGHVLDVDTGTVQCQWAPQFGNRLALSDFDLDGMEEIVYGTYAGAIDAFDVDTCLPKWSFSVNYLDTLTIGDTDADGTEELVVGRGAPGKLEAYDLTTQALLWQIDNPHFGFTTIALLDADGDSQDEILWGAGIFSSAANTMYVVDAATHAIEWENTEYLGPFLGPYLGDVDGDGTEEVITASAGSQGYQSGIVILLEQDDLTPIVSTAINYHDLDHISIHDLDGDGDMEVLTTGEENIEAYDLVGGVFQRVWDFSDPVLRPKFTCVEAVDLDQDGTLEIVAASTGPPEIFIYDYLTQSQEQVVAINGGWWDRIEQLEIQDVDGDGELEILGRFKGGDCVVLGPDTTLEHTFFGDYWSLEVKERGIGVPSRVYLGDAAGAITLHLWDGIQYSSLGQLDIFSGPVLGYHVVDPARIMISGAQSLHAYHIATGALLWQGGDYGPDFGRRLLRLDNGDIAVSGEYAVYAFGIR